MVTACSSSSAAIVLTAGLSSTEAGGVQGAVVGSLRRDAGGLATLYRNLGMLHTQGYAVSWATLLADVAGEVVPLPTYAFQRQRYWLEPARSLGDVAAAGLSPSPHPLLGAATTLANQDGVLFTTRLSLADHPWLADHTVFGNVLLPGTAVLELALAAAQAVGGCTVAELMQSAPVVLTLQGAVRLQLFAGEPDGTGARAFALYSRDDAAAEDAPWTCHATGLLSAGKDPGAAADSGVALEEWPPAGAVAVDLAEFYPKLASQGFGYGPAFRGPGRGLAERAARCTAGPCCPIGSPRWPAITASTRRCWTRGFTSWRRASPGSATRTAEARARCCFRSHGRM